MLIGLLCLTSGGGITKQGPATLEDKKGPLRIVEDSRSAAQKAAGKKAVPLGFQACVALLVASLVLLIAAAVNLFSGM